MTDAERLKFLLDYCEQCPETVHRISLELQYKFNLGSNHLAYLIAYFIEEEKKHGKQGSTNI